ncbi:gamma-glutamyltransferase [Novosphingobium sp. PC22D]|uniref:gamma-glutamyltransferase n=1 Tax=Novosphingobium sp. PC22D TaxID=1962403 RepID=UPI000BEF2E99|nr:gamma-glutamyltransferase [Novosphingobium sp. PC22D]PEQ12238.1 gamma-glutamyltransferase [Novosphingobium sp. PC22D]
MVSAADPRAVAAGVEMLRKGGSATDAAIATMLVLNVVEPQNSGIGGGLFSVRHDGATGKIETLDGREAAPGAAGPDWFYGTDGKPLSGRDIYHGGRAAGVPGALAAMAEAHRRWGKLAWAELFAPAIGLAREGFVVSARMHNGLDLYGRHVTGWAREAYFPGGEAVAEGATLKLPVMAATLERLAEEGPEPFYRGDIAEKIAAALNGAEKVPSAMTAADLAGYTVIEHDPVCGTYRVYRICGMGPPASGGVIVLAILKQLERFDMAGLGRESPVAWHLLAESERLAYADRNMYVADPGFTQVPVAGLTDPKYLASRSALLSPERSLATIAAGKPEGAPERLAAPEWADQGTSSLTVADGAGNIQQITTTINGYFGNGIAVGGLMLNNELADFDAVPAKDGYLAANRVEGGKRPRSSLSPTIVYAPDGSVRMAIGAAGGSTIIAQVAKALVGVLDWNMSAQDAIAMGLIYAPGTKKATVEEGTELVAMVPALRALGEEIEVAPLGLKANAIERVEGRWVGAADPRSEGVAMDISGNVTQIRRRSNSLNGAHE